MVNRIALISIVVEDYTATQQINELLHQHRGYIIGRMGIPYAKRDIALISVAIDAPQQEISALSGKLGMLEGVAIKTLYSSVGGE